KPWKIWSIEPAAINSQSVSDALITLRPNTPFMIYGEISSPKLRPNFESLLRHHQTFKGGLLRFFRCLYLRLSLYTSPNLSCIALIIYGSVQIYSWGLRSCLKRLRQWITLP